MKTEDLMIGNWVYNSFLKKAVEVSNLHFLKIYDSERLEPIPLTEENIVELLGFERLESGVAPFYRKGSFIVDFCINKTEYSNEFYPIPKHVHKLQQLIKSLEE